MERISVLLVDDHRVVRQGLRDFLELQDDIEVVGEASSGEEGVKQAQDLLPDVVLMDLVLPGIDGVEAIRRIRTMPAPLAQIPIIGVSGRGEDEAASREAGADAFLVKPVSPRDLAIALLEARRREEAAT